MSYTRDELPAAFWGNVELVAEGGLLAVEFDPELGAVDAGPALALELGRRRLGIVSRVSMLLLMS